MNYGVPLTSSFESFVSNADPKSIKNKFSKGL